MKDYNPTSVKEVGEPDQHGNKAYSVFFEGEDKPVFMKAKNAPAVGNVEYGVIEDAPKKSGEGTYRKFSRKQREEGTAQPVRLLTPQQPFSNRDESIYRQSALKSAVAVGEKDPEKILNLADDFLTWLKNDAPTGGAVEEVPLPEPQGEVMDTEGEINIEDIPF